MNEDVLNMSIRKYLKKVGVTSQREIEAAVRKAAETGKLPVAKGLDVKVTLSMGELGLKVEIPGTIELD
ncbi:MAG: DUF6494 family protein [Kiloniellales bacterium]|nr:DUF6494 family protein [Kiloniellales bacterium]